MSLDRELLTRYLRQLAELGGPAIYLDSMRADDVLNVNPESRVSSLESRVRDHEEPGTGGVGLTTHAAGLATLAAEAASCTRCRLHEGRRTVVFGEGSADARLVVVGEAPGYEEDRSGRPFVGPAGRMLDLLLMSGGFPRASVYICNVLKCRPPNNRDPLPDEVTTCTSAFLRPQLEAIAPRALLAVGKFAAQTLVGSDESIGRMRGRIHSYRGIPLLVTYHPAFLLRTPTMARAAWDDVQLVRKVLDEQA